MNTQQALDKIENTILHKQFSVINQCMETLESTMTYGLITNLVLIALLTFTYYRLRIAKAEIKHLKKIKDEEKE